MICKGDDPFRKEANMRHKIIINVTNEKGQKTNVLKGAVGKIPNRLIKFLFGDYRQIYLLDPGMTLFSPFSISLTSTESTVIPGSNR